MSKNLVVKNNALINASYNLELVEQRLILLSIIEVRATNKGITPNDKLTIAASSYMNNFNTSRNAAYKALKEACNNLFERQFSFVERTEKSDKIVRTRWVSRVAYLESEAMVELTFAPDVAPLITLLENNFTSYELQQVSELNSKYAVRLYEIIIAWRSTGRTPMFAIDELRDCLGVLANEYTELKNLKARVIDFAVKQINERTDITMIYEQHKLGRKIVGFTFVIIEQKQNTVVKETKKNRKERERVTKPVDVFKGLNEQEKNIIQKEVDDYLAFKESKGEKITDFYRQNIINKAIVQRWGMAEFEAKQAQKQAEKAYRAKQQAEKQAEEERQIQARIQSEQRRQTLISTFEDLPPEQQEFILDEVAKQVHGVLYTTFKKDRSENKAHENPMFASYFRELLGI